MDPIYFWIIILLLILFVLEYVDKNYNQKQKVEPFENHPVVNPADPIDTIDYTDYIYPKQDSTPYFEENKLVSFETPYTSSGLNFGSSKLYFQNFTTNGIGWTQHFMSKFYAAKLKIRARLSTPYGMRWRDWRIWATATC